ncbi:kinase-like domain-containing protein [Rhizophagus irregularis DAOM 181602=DAOM 197198]|nr:kinase-like domain-containing protein [Rhizophagus irregularis DAOM 181602=DAOM 197198]
MSSDNKTNTNEWINRIEEKTIITKTDIAENTQFSSERGLNEETLLTTNISELQGKLSQIFDKINIKEINPITVSKEREKLSFEKVMLGYCYEIGIGIEIDMQKAFELYQKSADLENMVAQYNLGVMYENGKEITKDLNKAIYWYKKSAQQGYQKAHYRLNLLQYQ